MTCVLIRSFLRASFRLKRLETRINKSGPRPNMTSGFRYRRYLRRVKRDASIYSSIVMTQMSPTPRLSRFPLDAWWIECSRFHFSYGNNVKIPVIVPTMAFAFLFLKNDPWVQSWKMMNIRTTNPAARIANGIARNTDSFRASYARNHRTRNGRIVLIICRTLALMSAFSNGDTCLRSWAIFSLLIVVLPPRVVSAFTTLSKIVKLKYETSERWS